MAESTRATDDPLPRKSPLQFSLRSVLLMITVAAIVCALGRWAGWFIALTSAALVVPAVFAVLVGTGRKASFGPVLLAAAAASGLASGTVALAFSVLLPVGARAALPFLGEAYVIVAILFGAPAGMFVGLAVESVRRPLCRLISRPHPNVPDSAILIRNQRK